MVAIPKPTVQLPVMILAIKMVSVVAMVLHDRVFARLRFLPACPVPSICSVTMCSGFVKVMFFAGHDEG